MRPYMITLRASGEVTRMMDGRMEGIKLGIGYVAARAHWGKANFTEATRAIIDLALQQSSIQRVCAPTDRESAASRRVLAKVGMDCEGVLWKAILHSSIRDIPQDSQIFTIVN